VYSISLHVASVRASRAGKECAVKSKPCAAATAEDFHDEVGNTITRMTVLTSVLQSKVKEPEALRIIEQIRENAGGSTVAHATFCGR
jgi:hypothetical protein